MTDGELFEALVQAALPEYAAWSPPPERDDLSFGEWFGEEELLAKLRSVAAQRARERAQPEGSSPQSASPPPQKSKRSTPKKQPRAPYRPKNPVSDVDRAAAREALRRSGLIALKGGR